MRKILRKLLSIWQKKDGVSAVEYGLMIGLIALAISISVNQMGIKLSRTFSTAAQGIAAPTGNGNANANNPNSGDNNSNNNSNKAPKKTNKKNKGGKSPKKG